MRSICLWNFKSAAWILFELCSGQNSRMKMNKGQLLQKYESLSYGFCALHLNEIYLPMKFHVDALHSFKVMLRIKKGWTDGRTTLLMGICWAFFLNYPTSEKLPNKRLTEWMKCSHRCSPSVCPEGWTDWLTDGRTSRLLFATLWGHKNELYATLWGITINLSCTTGTDRKFHHLIYK